ncbi:energy-coupling factor transporter transmembrane component T [Palleronia sp. LCG004]|uniref:energy-coupling factor transporter transmembrane component T family protein n=1 Tax=Palleronia sp. LCG004 TaxID=3079304 RepID=UPI002943A07B|nr:energy-coupling factor transporter transmembrane component T [Palleronia sp. LCG004]WOI56386.1 energy-coupling factor transporter transmembrane component T [Palleronia sp. LCG004]
MLALSSPVRTHAHLWPAWLKLAGLCVATLVLFAIGHPWGQALAALAVLALFLAPGRIFARAGLRRLWPLWPFVVLILLWNGLTGDWAEGATIALRLLSAVGIATLVTMTTQLSEMIAVVRALASPLRRFGISTRPVELGIALVLRFTPALMSRAAQLRMAWRARSCHAPSWRVLAPLAISALDDADHVADALRARGGLIEEGNDRHGT